MEKSKIMIKINFVGDILFGELFSSYGVGVKTIIEQDIDPFEYVSNQLKTADLNIGNLECVLSDKSNRLGIFKDIMRGKPEYIKLLVNKIQVVNLANNHTFDHGEEAFLEMKKKLKENKISFFGHPYNNDCIPLIIKKNDTTLGFIGFNLSNNTPEKLYELKNRIIDIIKKIKGSVDILILSIHWGLEYVNAPIDWQVIFAKEFFNNGVDIIHGHHSHRIQGYVFKNNKLVMFNCGNFIFDDRRKKNRYTGIIKVKIKDKNIHSVNITPLYLNKRYQPEYVDLNSIKKKYDNLNSLASKMYNTDLIDLKNASKTIIEESMKGHFYNRLYILFNLISRFYKYSPHYLFLIKTKFGKKIE